MKTMVWMAVAGVIWTCWGCKDENGVKKGKDEPWVVEIKSFEGDELKVSDILARIDTVELYTDGKAMASIGDLCFLDSMVYILDASKAVSAFNLRTGRLCKQIRTVGRGHNEYIMPNTIASGGGRVHLMDFSGRCILSYDADLNLLHRTPVDFMMHDIIPVDDGFLLSNSSPGDREELIIHTDTSGKVLGKFLSADLSQAIWPVGKPFIRNPKGDVFLKAPFSNGIYVWRDTVLVLAYRADYGSLTPEQGREAEDFLSAGKVGTFHDFLTSDRWLGIFEYADEVYCHMESLSDGQFHLQGKLVRDVPGFYPQWQYGEALVGVVHGDDYGSEAKLQETRLGAILFFYYLK